jgi:hypothetical protein
VTARLEPATIDGLVYCSTMVVLYAARSPLRTPGLARLPFGLGIVATLATNLARTTSADQWTNQHQGCGWLVHGVDSSRANSPQSKKLSPEGSRCWTGPTIDADRASDPTGPVQTTYNSRWPTGRQ